MLRFLKSGESAERWKGRRTSGKPSNVERRKTVERRKIVVRRSTALPTLDVRRPTGLFQTAVELRQHHADSFRCRRKLIMHGVVE